MITSSKSGLLNITVPPNKEKTLKFLINEITDKQRDAGTPKYCFLLGAGTSVDAGIPGGGGVTHYVRKRCFLREEHIGYKDENLRYDQIDTYLMDNRLQEDFDIYVARKEEEFKQRIDADKDWYIQSLPTGLQEAVKADSAWDELREAFCQSSFYGMWFDEYSAGPRARQELIEELIDGKEPSAGYILLALLVEKDIVRHFFTTNFDDLVHDAIFSEAGKKSRVFAHNETAHFINFKSKRPNIIKLHGDYLYQNIRNTVGETSKLDETQKKKLLEASNELGLVIMGYSGSDQSIMDALETIKQDRGSDFSIIWCGRGKDSLNWRAKHFIRQYSNTWYVEIEGFDQLMVKLYIECGCELKSLKKRVDKVEKDFNNVTAIIKAGNLNQQNPDEKLDQTLSVTQMLIEAYAEKDLQKRLIKQNDIVEKYSKEASVYVERGSTLDDLNDYINAIADYNQAIALRPEYADAYFYRAIVKSKQGDLTGAIADYDQAIALRPDYAEAYNNRANSKRKLGNLKDASTDVQTALRLQPKNGYMYSTAAEIYAQMDNEMLFYVNVEQALRYGCPVWESLDDEAYSTYRHNPRFKALLDLYRDTNS